MKKLIKENDSRVFLKYVLQSILGMMGFSLYILADTYFISNYVGEIGIGALNIALPIYYFITAITAFLSVGGGTLFSIYRGKEEYNKANSIFSFTIINGILVSIIFIVLGIFFSDRISILLGASFNMIKYTNIYLKVILILSPLMIINNILINFLRNDGNPNLAMKCMLYGTFLNIVLDYIFVGILNLGMFGASFATGIAPIISLVTLYRWIREKKLNFKVKYSIKILKEICICGLASFILEFSTGIVIFLFNIVILKIGGEVTLAAYGILANIALVFIYTFNGLCQGIQPMISLKFGQEDEEGLKKILKVSLCLALVIGVFIYTVSLIGANNIISIFNKDNSEKIMNIAKSGMYIYFTAFIIYGINSVIITFYQSTLKGKKAFIISLFRGFILIVIFIILLPSIFGIIGVWLIIPVVEIIIFIYFFIIKLKSI